MRKKITLYSIVLLLIGILLIFVFINVINHKTVYIPRAPYDKTGFIHQSDYSSEEIVLENEQFKFILHTESTNFELLDKQTGETWYSTPQHDTLLIPADARELFVLFYERKIEASRRVSINEQSIDYGNFYFRLANNVIEVLYEVGGKQNYAMSDLPRQIGDDDFQTLIIEPLEEKALTDSTIRRQLTFLKAQFNYVDSEKRHYLRTLTSQDSIDIVYNLIFNESLYTYENYLFDASRFGFDIAVDLPYFEFSVQYQLTDQGFNIRLVNDSIIESERFPIAYIDVLPFFGSGNIDDDGYTVLPDGSGIYIDHNNQKFQTVGYEKRVYGTDLSIGVAAEIQPPVEQRLAFPMFGYNKNGFGYLSVILQGDAMSTLRAGFLTEASGGNFIHKIPYAHFRYSIRERDAFIFRSASDSQRVTSWTTTYNTEDFVLEYQFIPKPNSTYFDMVKKYQNHLVETYLLEQIVQQERLHITLLGGYVDKKYILGFPYSSVESLTSVSQVKDIRDEIIALGISQFSMTYSGFSNQGIKSTTYLKTGYNENIATRSQLRKLVNEFNDDGMKFYLEFPTLYAHTDKNLNIDRHVTQNIFHNAVYRFPYSQATRLADKSKTISYIQNASATYQVMQNIVRTSNDLSSTHIALTDFGTRLASNLNKRETMFRNEIVNQNQQAITLLNEYNIQMRNPNLYALIYATEILDLSMTGTMHPIVDYYIPFIPLVLNGYFNYAGQSINTNDRESVNWHMLKAIETGANIQFTFTHDETTKLIHTEYNYLISTYYKNWLSDLRYIYNSIETLNITDKNIINHRVLNPQGSLVEVTYEGNIVIRINYETESYVVIS